MRRLSLLFILLFIFKSSNLQASVLLETTFPKTAIDTQLHPLMLEFVKLSDRAGITLPLQQRITEIKVLPHQELLDSISTPGDVMAVTIFEKDSRDASILISAELLNSPVELKVLLYHELLHAAGFDHPKKRCTWAETGCGIMGYSPYPHIKMGTDHANFVIKTSFSRTYLRKLPRVAL